MNLNRTGARDMPRISLDLLVNLMQSVAEIEHQLASAGMSAKEIQAFESWGRHRAGAERLGVDAVQLYKERGLVTTT